MFGRKLLIVCVIAIAALGAPAAAAEIRIAAAGPMTGVYAWAGEQYQRGAALAVDDLNAKGGVLGQSVELIVGDDFCDADQAVALARKLVERRRRLRRRALVLARLDPGLEGLRGGRDPADRPGLRQREADRRRRPERVPRLRPGRPARRDGRRIPGRPLGGQRDRDPGRRYDLGNGRRRWGKTQAARARRDAWPWMRPSPQARRSTPRWSPRCRPRASMCCFSAATTARRA